VIKQSVDGFTLSFLLLGVHEEFEVTPEEFFD
jgi:hypothetical protein